MDNVDSFWLSLGATLHINAPEYFGQDDVKTSDDFMIKFMKKYWNGDRVVLFIDEFDALVEVHDDIKSSCLGIIRAIKNLGSNFAILSSVVIGPFNIVYLNSDTISFNITEPFENPNFTLKQVQTVYKEFEDDFKLTIDPEIIEDIYNRTNGYVNM